MFAAYKRVENLSLRQLQTFALVIEFALCKLTDMTKPFSIIDLRRELEITQSELAESVGLANKASISLIERGGPCSVIVALRIEALSQGRISAASLNPDVALVDKARAGGDHGDGDTAADPAPSCGKADQISAAANHSDVPGEGVAA